MKQNFEHALSIAGRHKELPFPPEEFHARLARTREAMAKAGIDLLFVTAPESLYYLSGFQGEWYQAQSGRAVSPDQRHRGPCRPRPLPSISRPRARPC